MANNEYPLCLSCENGGEYERISIEQGVVRRQPHLKQVKGRQILPETK